MSAILDYPARLNKLQLIGDIMAGVQVKPKLGKEYPLDGSESFRIKLVR